MDGCVGIVSEYNPFHNGHKYHTEYIKNAGCENIIAAMSGACVQRGEFAILSKYDRADIALSGGVDAVIEIPAPFSLKSAEGFAQAGIMTLKNAGCDAISFGCECSDTGLLNEIAAYLLTDEYETSLSEYIKNGIPFAEAREKAVFSAIPQSAGILSQSNNILAVEYLKACRKLGWNPSVIAVKRDGENYNSENIDGRNPSAAAIRKAVSEFRYESAVNAIPVSAQSKFTECLDRGRFFLSGDASYEKLLLYKLRTSDFSDFIKIPDCNEEIAYSFEKAAIHSSSMAEFMNNMPTKRYTRARINRILTSLVVGIDNSMPKDIQYLRILGVKREKEFLLNHIAGNSALPVSHSSKILSGKSEGCRKIAEAESRACDIQSAFFRITGDAGTDFTTKIIKK